MNSLLVTDNWRHSVLPATDSSDQHLLKINKMVYFIYTYVPKKFIQLKYQISDLVTILFKIISFV